MSFKKSKRAYCCSAFVVFIAQILSINSSAFAVEDIQVHGFATAGYTVSDEDVAFMGVVDDRGDFELDSILGLQIDVKIDDKLSLTTQAVISNKNDESLRAEWAFLRYRLDDNVTIRGGRLRTPFFMLSDSLEVGHTYPWVRPPQEVYGERHVPFSSFTGIDFLINFELGSAQLELKPWIGDSDITISKVVPIFEGAEFETDDQWGLNTTLSFDSLTFSAGWSTRLFSMEGVPLPPSVLLPVRGDFLGFGFIGDWDNLLLMGEFTKADFDDPFFDDRESWYATIGYRIGDWMPHLTLAELDGDSAPVPLAHQESITIGLRYEVSANSALKIEVQQVQVNNEPFSIGLFAGPIEDDANIFSIAYDLIF